jgi:hypothetical protein
MKTNLLVIAFIAICAGFTACKSSKPSVEKGAMEVFIPFSESKYRTDKEFFRATASGKSPDLSTAKKIALLNAKAEMSSNIESVIKSVTENYTKQVSVEDRQAYENLFEQNTREVVNQTLSGVVIEDQKVFKDSDGKYTCYVVIQMNKSSLIEGASDKISKNEKLQVEFDRHQFRKVFDEEMEKFEKERGN